MLDLSVYRLPYPSALACLHICASISCEHVNYLILIMSVNLATLKEHSLWSLSQWREPLTTALQLITNWYKLFIQATQT